MEQLPCQIAKIIEGTGLSGINQGLLQGDTGLCVFYYLLSRQTNNSKYEKLADDLLDKVFANLTTSASTDFDSGLAGIGWGIEYLVQHNFAEGDTDEILEEVDNKVFRSLNEENHSSFELGNGLTGYLFYLISRLKDKPVTRSIAQRINRELLILTINKIDELVTVQFPALVKEIQFDLFWRFPVMLYGLTEAFQLTTYNAKIVCMIQQWRPNFEGYIPSLHIHRLFLAVILKRIYNLIPENYLEKQGRILLFATDFEILKTEVNHDLLNIRFGWPGFAWLLKIAAEEIPTDWPNQPLISQTYREITLIHKNPLEIIMIDSQQINRIQYSLSLGLAGVGLLEILWQGILSGSFTNEIYGDD